MAPCISLLYPNVTLEVISGLVVHLARHVTLVPADFSCRIGDGPGFK